MIIADTGFWLALANQADQHHEQAKSRLNELDEALISTWPVVTETCHLLLNRLGSSSQPSFLHSYSQGAFDIFDIRRDEAPRLASLMIQYESLPMDLADASLVLLAEHLGHGRILSTDRRDFAAYRLKERQPFENLLL